MHPFSVHSTGPADTAAIAARLAPFLRPGDAVILTGDPASGKTHFVKALARALGSDDGVTSPTYAIANFYTLPTGRLLHVDAYRLSGMDEYRDLGLEDFYAESITVVEWGEKVADDFAGYLQITFTFDPADTNARTLVFSPTPGRWAPDVERLKTALSHART